MLIFGHRFIPSESFYHVLDIESISNTPPSSVIHVEFSEENLDIITHAKINQIATSIYAEDITQIIYASSLEASFIVVDKELANSAHKIANEYLFDAKILVLVEDETEIEELALLGVDGVIFSNAIIKINS
ncbi:hypothetical protein [Sulfurimonas sp.]